MELFITIFAVIWFLLFTCLGNIGLLIELKTNRKVKLKPWAVIGDILVVSWLIKKAIECIS